ncbi:rod shape-determining protein MreD [Pasteurella canis]|uniref:Rod shape-determining protein MreD n=1 Tax=Pasteurella canis TaxID=753 RepID=A0ABQ4VHQ1_9PAST|nr:rod shape-determining protein MreD [Pasteurella canis]MXN88347.1 rod shape-determining protein MreD [Pasteurella canis]UAY77019.1 rod shape-determining protein MreD [Pasteurella canis]UDW83055.1 rod shape-determining protein MreD [Pasteurella canis]UEA16156.1 rod shape-determining protein MreD [Pasteurella canis]UEC22592.1 rod shape-determining protein MreD [Pasteurella canis]
MEKRFLLQWLILICTFIVALVMEIAPWPVDFQNFKPAWLVLVLLYWALSVPNKVSIGTAFVLGVVWDLVLGSILGVHALILSIFIYLVALNHLILRNLSLWMQSLLVVCFVFAIRIGIFLIELLLHSASFNWQEIYGALASGLLWPWVFLLLRRIRRQLQLR